MLITTGLHDSQVQYWEPAEMGGKTACHQNRFQPPLPSRNMDAGHGGSSGRFCHPQGNRPGLCLSD
ncbi:MAG: hypothetical protein R3B47_16725 [Bacteroidia bacterium]